MTPTLFGIRGCDTMKKARAWLDGAGITYRFHDYKVSGIDRATLEGWVAEHGWEKVLNRAGTTFRKLPEEAQAGLDAGRAIDLMLAQPSMIKRPVLDTGAARTLGFSAEGYARLFKA
jgi:arsenate reductase